MADKFNLDGFAVDENDVCTAEGGFVGDVTGRNIIPVLDYTATTGTINSDSGIVNFDSTSGAIAVALTDGIEGDTIILSHTVSANAVQIAPLSLGAAGTLVVIPAIGDSVHLYFDGSDWQPSASFGTGNII
jgi:hypothetical protein